MEKKREAKCSKEEAAGKSTIAPESSVSRGRTLWKIYMLTVCIHWVRVRVAKSAVSPSGAQYD